MMNERKFTLIYLVLIALGINLHAQENNRKDFEFFFVDKTLRIDYVLAGNSDTEQFILKDFKVVDKWAGSTILPDSIDPVKGNYRIALYDSLTNQEIYSQGFSNLFQEWQATPEAKKSWQSHYQVSLVPMPLRTVKLTFSKAHYNDRNYSVVNQFYINPRDKFNRNEKPSNYNYQILQGGGDIHHRVDLAFIAEGYTRDEMKKFRNDSKRVWDYMASLPPYNQLVDKFNVYAIETPSVESGTDIPIKGIYKNTLLDFSFSTFDIDRYLAVADVKAIHDAASVVPYDFVFVLINSSEYGGSGFYNVFASSTVDHKYSLKVAVHEFGHCFAGLADEYYSSSVAVESYYSMACEPWEPNITTMVNFESKWQNMLDSVIPVPTPRLPEFDGKLGVFEGGGYSAKGIYSPAQDCVMKSNNVKVFCPVCEQALKQTILFYSR